MPAETVYDVLVRAIKIATTRRDAHVGAAHLTLALLDCPADDRARQLLNICAIKRDEMRLYVESTLGPPMPNATENPRPNARVGAMLRDASRQAHDYHEAENQIALLLISLANERGPNGEVLRSLGLRPAELRLKLREITRAAKPNGNPLKMLDGDAQLALEAAHRVMRASGCGRISTAHLLLGILENRAVYALQLSLDNGVDLDELARLARAAVASDGEIATAQIRLDKGAKRALERARDITPSLSRRRPIAPQALLWSLLPRPTTLRERMRWGEPNDPLARVWRGFDVMPIERVMSALLGVQVASVAAPATTKTAASLDWRGALAGALWTSFCSARLFRFENREALIWFFAGFGAALYADWWGRTTQSSFLRSAALSFLASCVAMGALWAFLLLMLGG